jgi:tetratricopeptide (TPR) repeat protein
MTTAPAAATSAATPTTVALPVAAPITNATPAQLRAVEATLDRLGQAAAARDVEALKLLDLAPDDIGRYTLTAQLRATHVAVSPTGALVRVAYRVTASGGTRSTRGSSLPGLLVPPLEGIVELWLSRGAANGFDLTDSRWSPPLDAVDAFAGAASEEWNEVARQAAAAATSDGTASIGTAPAKAATGALLQLVAERRGGRWIALRRKRWDGEIADVATLARLANAGRKAGAAAWRDDPTSMRSWLAGQMARYNDRPTAGTAHFVLQRSDLGWVGLGSVWDANALLAREDEKAASARRQKILGDDYTSAEAHRDFGLALAKVGLFAEAADELEKAEALQPGTVEAARLREIVARRGEDPQALAVLQVQNERTIGLASEHPIYRINALIRQQTTQPTVLSALQLGLEYSKLADDERALKWLRHAHDKIASGALKGASRNEVAWARILYDQLDERQRMAPYKPPQIVRSGLFTVRCWPNDLSAIQLMAGLESAQHKVYADFGIPMGNTEVVLWRNQSEFQNYTARLSGQATSEFIAALTLTKLVAAESGPIVLSEEINVFADPRANTISTIAHEYGHVAVRQLSRGRAVPMWFNEGIAAQVEGGYENYRSRVQLAAARGRLLSMAEMQLWDVDGERAFLAYSQANSMIDYIIEHWGHAAILEILRQLGRDVSSDAAFLGVLKITPQELWNRWARDGIK